MELCLKNLSKDYSKKKAINNLNISFTNGLYALLGPNGSGKSTLMNLLCGLISPTSGKIMYGTIDISKNKDVLYEQLGYLPQTFNFYPDFTVSDFLTYLGTLKGIHLDDLKTKINIALKKVNLTTKIDKKIKNLSGGMQRRLGIAQAIINDPKILVLDEQTTGLDPRERASFKKLVSDLAKDRLVIVSTHIVSDIADIADNIIFLKKGSIVLTGNIDKILKTINGNVWLATVDQESGEKLEEQYIISKAYYLPNNDIQYRIISDNRPCELAKPSTSCLDDVYLSIFNEVSEGEKHENFN